jgi:hypothetical protein
MNLFYKQPADQLDYDLDFSDWITEGDTITGAVAVSSVPAELVIQSVSVSEQIVKVWATGGETGSTYQVTVTVTTDQGRIKELDFKIRVKEL